MYTNQRKTKDKIMHMLFKRYVGMSERSLSDIALEIKQSRQNCLHWVNRNTKIFVQIDARRPEKIIEVYRHEKLYPAKVAKTTKKVKRQVRK